MQMLPVRDVCDCHFCNVLLLMVDGAVVDANCMRFRPSHAARRLVGRADDGEGTSGFAVRLAISFAVTLAIVGFVGYLYMDRQLRDSHIAQFAAAQRTDAKTFESYAARSPSTSASIKRIDEAMDLIAHRAGTVETLLISPSGIVRASGNDVRLGTRDRDPRIDAALRHGASFAGHEASASRDSSDFEFVTPVNLPDGRYAFEISYDHNVLDAQLADVRHGLVLVGVLALLVFYVVGGRTLLSTHRKALKRATRDGLTDLPNHRAFQDDFPQAVAAAVRNQESLALVALDVDDFKSINDRYGHPHGDAILRRVAEVLRNLRPEDRAYRIGGDEFAVLLPHTDAEGVHVLGRRLIRNLREATLEVTIGVSSARPGQSAEHLRAEADAALYEAKRRGGDQVAHFDDIRDDVVVTSPHKRQAVRSLIDERRLTTAFQPIWDMAQGRLVGVEALMRPDAACGLTGPAEAFDIAEQLGRVHELDMLCVEDALAAAPDLPDGALLFLNLCPSTLGLDADANDWLRSAVQQAGLPVDRVVIEVTERLGARSASIIKCLKRLRAQGFTFAIDDVGTGNSGLAMLRQIEVEYVKIDRSIVAAAPTEPGARAVLMAIAAYAQQTGAFVIAEGVEDDETVAFLCGIDDRVLHGESVIRGGQGYALGRPGAIHDATSSPLLPSLPKAA
jgi:diguanylate cyclase (GGDEF)-like protein